MRSLILLLFLCINLPAHATWELSSAFQLHLKAKVFDAVVNDFWKRLQGKQIIPLQNITISDPIPIWITGIRAELQYDFPLPQRDERERKWHIASKSLQAKLFVQSINATQTIVREINGILVTIHLEAECRNIEMSLPTGNSSVQATLRADLIENQVQLSMPEFLAAWAPGTWQVDRMDCSGVEGFEQVVKREALKALHNIQSFESAIAQAIHKELKNWSKDASLLLLSSQELPSQREDQKIYFELKEAFDSQDGGVSIRGRLRFVYPYIAHNDFIKHEFEFKKEDHLQANELAASDSYLKIPLDTIRGLFMGEYLSGKLDYSMRSYELKPFHDLMQSRWAQFFAWPDLMRFKKNTTFAFQFLVFGAPAFQNARNAEPGQIQGQMILPLSIRMFAPENGLYVPYVEFQTTLAGDSKLRLEKEGKVHLQVAAENLQIQYRWNKKYLDAYRPSTRIAIKTITSALQKSLNSEGIKLGIPPLKIGQSVLLKPLDWNLEKEDVFVRFDVGH